MKDYTPYNLTALTIHREFTFAQSRQVIHEM
jgi:hypothetical protein